MSFWTNFCDAARGEKTSWCDAPKPLIDAEISAAQIIRARKAARAAAMEKARAAAAIAAVARPARKARGRHRKILRGERGFPVAEVPQITRAWAFLDLPEGTRRFTVTYEMAKKCREARAKLSMTQRDVINIAMCSTRVVPELEKSGGGISISSAAKVIAVLQGEVPVASPSKGGGKSPVPKKLAEQLIARRTSLGLSKTQTCKIGHFSCYTLRDIELGNLASPASVARLTEFYDDYEKRETTK